MNADRRPRPHPQPRRLHLVAVVAAFLVVLFTLGLLWPPTRSLTDRVLTRETGPVEVVTFLSFLGGSALAARLAMAARRRSAQNAAVCYLVFALFLGVAGMEEISWGQSLFDFPTPEWLDEINAQGETNMHNIDPITDLSSAFVFLFAVAGLATARLSRRHRPPLFTVPAPVLPLLAVIAATAAVEALNDLVYFGDRIAPVVGALTESTELYFAVACLMIVWINDGDLRAEWAEVAADELGPDRRVAA